MKINTDVQKLSAKPFAYKGWANILKCVLSIHYHYCSRMNKITFKYSFLLLKQFFQLSRMKWSEQEKRAHIISEKVKKQGIFLPVPVYGTGVICLCVSVCPCFGKSWKTFERMHQFRQNFHGLVDWCANKRYWQLNL